MKLDMVTWAARHRGSQDLVELSEFIEKHIFFLATSDADNLDIM